MTRTARKGVKKVKGHGNSAWAKRLRAMSPEERERYYEEERLRNKMARARRRAQRTGEPIPEALAQPSRTFRSGTLEWEQVELDNPTPIGKIPPGSRVVMERNSPVSDPNVYEIVRHSSGMAGTTVLNRSLASTRTFKAHDVETGEEKDVTITSGGRAFAICSHALVTHMLRPKGDSK